MVAFSVLMLASTLINGGAQASDGSANSRMPGCRPAVNSDLTIFTVMNVGFCNGVIDTLMVLGPLLNFCPPADATTGQGTRVVVQYIDSKPARLNEDFDALAVEAMRKAWPCPTSR
jgi:hypothetical protein